VSENFWPAAARRAILKSEMLPDTQSCYRAVAARDRRFDGVIFTAVRTTRIFCRPICPARTPLAKNVEFYSSAAAALAAGYRPCLRCRPEVSPGAPAWRGTEPTVDRALRAIDAGALDDASVEALAARLGVSGRHLRRLFVDHLGVTPVEVAQSRRALFAKSLITETPLPLEQIAYAAGYTTVRRFHQAIRQVYRRNPGELRRETGTGESAGVTLRLTYRPPYNWDALIGFLQPRAMAGREQIDARGYQREGLTVRHDAARHAVAVTLPGASVRQLHGLAMKARRMFDLDADAATIASDLQRSPLLRPLVQRHAGVRVPGCWDPFELAVRAILGQQVTVKGATTLMNRLLEQFGAASPEVLAGAPVERIGLPAKRAASIRAIASAVAAGELALDGSQLPEQVIERIVALPGLGPWTAHYIAMRALGAPDAFPASDLALLKAAGAKSARELEHMAEAWRPWRSYAAFYLWRSLD